MKKLLLIFASIISLCSCKLSNRNQGMEDNKELKSLFDKYYEERMRLFPLESTAIGETRYNDLLPADFTDSYRDTLANFYNHYRTDISKFNRDDLNDKDKISYDVFKREMEINLEGLRFPENYIPSTILGFAFDNGATGKRTGKPAF